MLKLAFVNIVFFVSILFIDQLSKYLIRIQGGFYICNKGISFGIQLPKTFILLLSVALILFLLILFFNLIGYGKSNYPLLLIISGATSNIVDRLHFGCVIDFIKLPYYPVFNLADTFIVIGGIISVWQLLNLHTPYGFKNIISRYSRLKK